MKKIFFFFILIFSLSFINAGADENFVEVYFKNDSISSAPQLYAYDGSNELTGSWSNCVYMGKKDDYFYYKISGVSNCKVIFKFASGQDPAQGKEGYSISGSMQYVNNVWSDYKFESSSSSGSEKMIIFLLTLITVGIYTSLFGNSFMSVFRNFYKELK